MKQRKLTARRWTAPNNPPLIDEILGLPDNPSICNPLETAMVMPKKPGNQLIDPQRIRALATGVGQSQQRSYMSGCRRAAEVAEDMPPGVASKAVGYPPAETEEGMMGMGMARGYCDDMDGPLSGDGKLDKMDMD